MASSRQQDGELLWRVLEALPYRVVVVDRDHRVILANGAARATLVAEDQRPETAPCYAAFHGSDKPCDPEERECPLAAVLASKQPFVTTHERTDPSSRRRVLQLHAVPLLDEAGEVAGIVETIRDATEQADIEATLTEAEGRFRTLFDCAADYLFVVDPTAEDGPIIVDANEAAAAAHGYSVEELIGLPMAVIDTPKARAHIRERAARLMAGVPQQFESEHVRKDGSTFPVEVSARLVRVGDKPLIFTIERDITERKAAEQTLLRASRLEATSTLAGGVAHDFNNLMVGVLTSAGLLARKLHNRPELHDLIATIEECGARAGTLSQKLLAFARGGKYTPAPLDVAEVVEETLRLQERSAPPGIRIERDMDADLWPILADRAQLGHVVMNLCLNAVEAIEGSGTVTVSARNAELDEEAAEQLPGLEAGEFVRISVQDTGIGMSEATRARIFEPFFSTKAQGRGLGLAAAHGIIRNHDGQLIVDSRAGRGTRIDVYLPTTPQRPGEAESGPVVGTGSETVLIIDDEQVVVAVMEEILRSLGYRVLAATSGQRAIELVREHKGDIHLAILDMGMPSMSGAELYERLIEARPAMKVIICSGYELDSSVQSLLEAGASAFLHKPFQVPELAACVRAALDPAARRR